jgi:putative flippase GtrA
MASTKNRSLSIKKIVAYSAVGTIAFVSEYLSFIIIINTLAIPYTLLVAQSISFGLGLVISFNGNRLFAFKDLLLILGLLHSIIIG